MKSLQIPADCDRLGEARTIIEFQHRHPAGRIFCKEFGCAALPGQDIDICQPKFDGLFCREDSNPTRVRRKGMIVEFQGIGHFNSSYVVCDGPSSDIGRPCVTCEIAFSALLVSWANAM